MVEREIRALEMLKDLDGIQKFYSRDSQTSFYSQYIPGDNLRTAALKLSEDYFNSLAKLIMECEHRGVYRVGVNRNDFLVTREFKPAIVDFGNVVFTDDVVAEVPLVMRAIHLYNVLRVHDIRNDYEMNGKLKGFENVRSPSKTLPTHSPLQIP